MAQPETTASSAEVFISYSRVDSGFVLDIATRLKQAGIPVWLDQLDIEPGRPWDDEIQNALDRCGRMMLILSPDAVKSRNVRDEVDSALDNNRRIIPILYRPCNRPFRWKRLQFLDFTQDREAAFDRLVHVLQGNGAIPAPQHPVQGRRWRRVGQAIGVFFAATGSIAAVLTFGVSSQWKQAAYRSTGLWPKPYEMPWVDDFALTSNLSSRWKYPANEWRLVKGEGENADAGAVEVASERIGTPSNLNKLAFYDFVLDFKAKFITGDVISWAVRVQQHEQAGYIVEAQKTNSGLSLTVFRYPGREALAAPSDVGISSCCRKGDAIRVITTVRACSFDFQVQLESPDANDDRQDIDAVFRTPTVTDKKCGYQYGNVGLTARPGSVTTFEYFRVKPIV